MNEKNNSKEEKPKRTPTITVSSKQDGWFSRNKRTIALVLVGIIIIVAVLGTFWCLSNRISSLKVALNNAEQQMQKLEKTVHAIQDNQQRIISTLNEVTAKLNESAQAEMGKKSKDSEKTAKVDKNTTDKSDDEITDSSWGLLLLLVIVVAVLIVIYFLIKKFRKKDYTNSY